MDLANAAQNEVRSIRAICPHPCRHQGEVPLDWFRQCGEPQQLATRRESPCRPNKPLQLLDNAKIAT